MKKKTFEKYLEIFEMEINSNEFIFTQDKKEKINISEIKNWKPCYKKGDKIRELLPQFWFISDKADIISVAKGKAYLLKKDDSDGKGRYSYHFYIHNADDTYSMKNIEAHNLLVLVYGGLTYGKADKLLEDRGLYAMGVKDRNKLNVQGHHIKNKDNSIDNVELLSTKAHDIVHKIPKEVIDDTCISFMNELGTLATDEEPNKISVLRTGQQVDKNTLEIIEDDTSRLLYATDDVKMSNNAIKQIQRYNIINIATDLLINSYGNDYFIEPKYLYTKDNTSYFYKCEMVADELKITEINDTRELANKHFIKCYVNADDKIECCIENK